MAFKDFRCLGKNKKNKICNQLMFKYEIKENEIIVQIKCPSCNTFNILHIPYVKNDKEK